MKSRIWVSWSGVTPRLGLCVSSAFAAAPMASESDRAAGQIPGDRIFQPYGAVVIVNSVGDFIGFALGTRVQTADDSLELGELANHFGGQVALGELRGAVGFRD